MTTLTNDQIKLAALNPDPAEREALAEELLLSVGQADRVAIDDAWLAEVRRRDADFLAGKSGAKPANELIDLLQRRSLPR